jgi:CDP-diglyceride synthetase
VKDSSALFPAMGGFFDTFDSIIFIPATMLFLIEIGHKVLA